MAYSSTRRYARSTNRKIRAKRRTNTTRSRKATTKMMRRVARQVTLKLAETKRFAIINEQLTPLAVAGPIANNFWSYRPVFSPLTNGFLSGQVIGNEIVDPLLKCKFTATFNWNDIYYANSNNYGDITLNVYLLASNDDFVNTTFSQIISGYPQDWFYQIDGHNPTFNGNNVKVLRKWRRRVSPDTLMGTAVIQGTKVVTGSLRYRWKRKLTFEDRVGTVPAAGPQPTREVALRRWNYHLVFGIRSKANWPYSTTATSIPLVTMDSFLYFKDP